MIESHYPSVEQLVQGQRTRRGLLLCGLVLAVLVIFGIMATIIRVSPDTSQYLVWIAGLAVFGLACLPLVIWINPRMSLYILFAGATLFEDIAQPAGLKVATMYVPFFWNLATAGRAIAKTEALAPLAFSLAEVIMVAGIVACFVRLILNRDFTFKTAGYLGWIAMYCTMVGWGFVNGTTTGGDQTMALYEVRAQFHMLAMFILAAHTITSRDHIIPLLWITVIATGIKGILSALAYFTSPTEIGYQGYLAHEEALFFNLLFFVVVLSLILRVDRRFLYASVALAPFALISVFANKRRAGIAAFIVAFIPLMPVLFTVVKDRRREFGAFLVGFTLLMCVYIPAAWNSDGAWALPVRAIKSVNNPNERDLASNEYRKIEDYDLEYTRDRNPWLGLGYGKPFYQPIPLAETNTGFVHYMPHNSVLWVWMRLGHFGFFAFMMMICAILIKAAMNLKVIKDPALQMAGMLGLVFVLMIFTAGKYDLALTSYRLMGLMGTMCAVVCLLPKLDADYTAELESKKQMPTGAG